MTTSQPVRIGIVGAGGNTRKRHIPGFREIEGVEITGVVNRSPKSTAKAAEEFEIPKTYSDWKELVADPEIDAVMIGTWPIMHSEITCAALEAGKHVLTEARMARTADEARRMLQVSQEHPDLVAQIVPSPFGLVQHDYVTDLIADGFLGDFRELIVFGANDLFQDSSQPLHWRQQQELSGLNILAMGILHEAAIRWAPQPSKVFAQTKLFDATRPPSPVTGNTEADIPDSVQIITELENGGRGLYHLSGVSLFGPGMQIHLYGSKGTIKYIAGEPDRLWIGAAGDKKLREAEIPKNKQGGWRVEAEFIGAILGEEQIRFTTFESGLKYMEFTQGVTQSAETGQPVSLPLSD